MHLNLYLEMVALVPWQLIDHNLVSELRSFGNWIYFNIHSQKAFFAIGFILASIHNEPFFVFI